MTLKVVTLLTGQMKLFSSSLGTLQGSHAGNGVPSRAQMRQVPVEAGYFFPSGIASPLLYFHSYVKMKPRIYSSKASSSTLPAFGKILFLSSPKWQHSQSSRVGWRQWRRIPSFPMYPCAEGIEIKGLFLSYLR